MEQGISLQVLIQCAFVISGVWGFYKIVMEIVKNITDRHDKEQEWTKTKEDLEKGRQEIVQRYDAKLTELEDKIDGNHADTEAKIQELKADMFILTKSLAAVLDGLKQQGCNGAVTEAKKELDSFLIDKAYE